MSDICIIQKLTLIQELLEERDFFVSAKDVADVIQEIKQLQFKLTARDESLDNANTQIERMREREKKLLEIAKHAALVKTHWQERWCDIDICINTSEWALKLKELTSDITPPTYKGERL